MSTSISQPTNRPSISIPFLLVLVALVALPVGAFAQPTTLHSFNGADGVSPYASLVLASDGNFYGTTYVGGSVSSGTIFRITPAGVLTTIHEFNDADGANPAARLLQASDGKLYGTTIQGGANGVGTIFRIDLAGGLTTLHSFSGTDGATPGAALIQASNGQFYGTTTNGGSNGKGTIFTMTSSGVVTTLYDFTGGADGTLPVGGVVQAANGTFYGTTHLGGANDLGTVYSFTAGTLTTLHEFDGATSGGMPVAALMQGADGALYGSTTDLGANGAGTIFRITTAGVLTTLHAFSGPDGRYPAGSLMQTIDGMFYGTTFDGGDNALGTIFKYDPLAGLTTLHSFAGAEGSNPYTALVKGADAALYGTALTGGANECGVVFRLSIAPPLGVPTITWSNPAAIGLGTALGPTQLNATADVAGTFVYNPSAGAVLAVGTHTLSVDFTPTDTDNYTTASATVSLTVNPVTSVLTYPTSGATDVDLTLPLQWTAIPNVQTYYLYVGSSVGAKNLVDSGETLATSMAVNVPGGQTLYARVWTKVGGVWRYSDSTFAGVQLISTLTTPTSGATNVSPSVTMQWTAIANVQTYYLYVGSTAGANDLVNSGETLQTSRSVSLPAAQTVYSRLWTKVGGVWRYSDASFTTAAVVSTITVPVNGATNADLTQPVQWSAVPNVQAYYLYLGTSVGAKNLVDSGETLQTSLSVNVPAGQTIYARLWTKVGGVWRSADSTFSFAPLAATITSPASGASGVPTSTTVQWTSIANVQAYYLYIGTAVGLKNLVDSGEILTTSRAVTLPAGQVVYARIWTKVGGVWRYTDSSFTTQ